MSPQLPAEVWSLVFGYLQPEVWPDDSQRPTYLSEDDINCIFALSQLCRVCTLFRRLAEPLIYTDLPAGHWKLCNRITTTLAESPRLAALVHKADLSDASMVETESLLRALDVSEHALPLSAESKGRLRQMIENDDDDDDRPDQWHALFLALVPQVTHLKVTLSNECPLFASWIQNALQQPELQSQTTILSQLQELCISYADTEYAFSIANIPDVFHLPALKTLRGHSVSLDRPQRDSERIPRPCAIEHVFLDHSLADADGIAWLLSQCHTSIRTLSICWGSATVGNNELDFDRIGAAFSQQQQQERPDGSRGSEESPLETLVLDCRECFSYEEGEWSGMIGSSLVGLKSLRQLTVPMDVLLGHKDQRFPVRTGQLSLESTLPDGLEELYLLNCYDDDDDEYQEAVQQEIRGVLTSSRLNSLHSVKVKDCPSLSSGFANIPGFQMRSKENGYLLVFTRA